MQKLSQIYFDLSNSKLPELAECFTPFKYQGIKIRNCITPNLLRYSRAKNLNLATKPLLLWAYTNISIKDFLRTLHVSFHDIGRFLISRHGKVHTNDGRPYF